MASPSASHSSERGLPLIVIAVDNSEHAEHSFMNYMKNIHKEEYTVKFLYSQELFLPPNMSTEPDGIFEAIQTARKTTADVEKKYKDAIAKHKLKGEVIINKKGQAGDFIVSYAKDHKASLVVIGIRGENPIRRTLLGGVTKHVLHYAPCPVCVTRKKRHLNNMRS